MALADKARGQHIKRLRESRRLTQQAMAEKLGIAYRTYQTWEAGTMPEWSNLERLATALGVRAEELIGEDPPAAASQSQLDRIEAKLDQLLEVLSPSSRAEGPAEVLEEAAARARAQRTPPAATSRRTPGRASKP